MSAGFALVPDRKTFCEHKFSPAGGMIAHFLPLHILMTVLIIITTIVLIKVSKLEHISVGLGGQWSSLDETHV